MKLPPPALLRRLQIVCVALGMLGVLASLAGGSLEIRPLAIGGLSGMLGCLAAILVLGLLTWRQER